MEYANPGPQKNSADCPSADIAAYIDGELSPDAELFLEHHFANCRVCSTELNEQKHFLNALNSSLTPDLEIPADFTKRIVANADSNVSGLRRRSEWLHAMFVCAGLLFFVLFTLGANARGAFLPFFDIAGRIAAVFVFAFHLVYDITFGVVVILRTIVAQPDLGIGTAIIFAALVIGLIFRYSPLSFKKEKIDQLKSGNGF
jgi:hypothetical protein